MPAPLADPTREHAPLVSVIVRSMDRPSLARALQSVAEQTHRPIEVLLVNARGATHTTPPTSWSDLAVRVVCAEDGRALPRAQAAQAGLQAATGAWALFLDDDDELLPTHLSRLVAAGQEQAQAVAVYADVDLGQMVDGVWQVQHRFAADFDPVRLLFENYLPIHAVLFRRDLAQRHARFDPAFELFEDWDFWLQLAQAGPFVRVPGVTARYVAPHAAGHSAVFEDSPAARSARERLFEKWRLRQSPQRYAQALNRLQAMFRRVGQMQAELEDLQRGHAEQAAVLQAREAELAGFVPLLAAREAEIASGRVELEAQQLLRAAREQELANALAAIEAQRELLVHREREAREGVEYAHSLRHTLAQREREIADAALQLTELRAAWEADRLALNQRNAELALRDAELAQRDAALAQCKAELAALHAEKPLQALARTLRRRTKPHGSRS